MPRKSKPIVVSPQTRARDLCDLDGVIINRGEFCRQPVDAVLLPSAGVNHSVLGDVANIRANTDMTRWKVPLTLEVSLPTKLEET